jgi:hypothetical protein
MVFLILIIRWVDGIFFFWRSCCLYVGITVIPSLQTRCAVNSRDLGYLQMSSLLPKKVSRCTASQSNCTILSNDEPLKMYDLSYFSCLILHGSHVLTTHNIMCKWFDIPMMHHRFLQPSFLQRCLHYKIHASRKKRYTLWLYCKKWGNPGFLWFKFDMPKEKKTVLL